MQKQRRSLRCGGVPFSRLGKITGVETGFSPDIAMTTRPRFDRSVCLITLIYPKLFRLEAQKR